MIIPSATIPDVPTERRHCQHCGTPIRVRVDMFLLAAFVTQHEETCAQKTDEERQFYRRHRRWPVRRHERPK